MDTNRLEAFSDGVFAIAITLLVLDIRVPLSNAALGRALLNLWPSYLAYAISFIVIGAIWINHHAMFERVVRTDQTFLLLNVLFLDVYRVSAVPHGGALAGLTRSRERILGYSILRWHPHGDWLAR